MDRNFFLVLIQNYNIGSLSARRAWIEMVVIVMVSVAGVVALRKESVDRNSTALASMRVSISRSPQGERG